MSVRKLGVSTLPKKGGSAPWFRVNLTDLNTARQRLQSAPDIVPIRRPSCPTFQINSASSGEESCSSESLSDETEDEVRNIFSPN